MSKVRKAIIPAAGLGTRFLPATKAMPKEMLPIVDKPMIQYIVEEAIASGIEDIIIVTGKGKRAIEDHFDHSFELEQNLLQKSKFDLLEKVQHSSKVEIHYIRQKEPRGLGHAIWCARRFIGNEPFAVLLGDDIVKSEVPCLKQIINHHEETSSSVLGIQEVPEDQIQRYGIIDPIERVGRKIRIGSLVEKPEKNAPSNLAIMGRYVLTPEIFTHLEKQKPGSGGEIQLTDAIQSLTNYQEVYGYQFEGVRFDVGEKLGYILTTIQFALNNEELKYKVMEELDGLLSKLNN
ncbi:UTP--glucose-1-phosphate uridylyltransferase GalU [Peribacillus asahii]|uniref:UTP--glucose-1-phosphate uridylyltransferase GalU n=1 Tax=Peribacillus asahii TaxID=228899 RepID=UPI0020793674|nr:UTP--glucose-1-phosphate uridylyltransferase GalU [Peribacillus asahii]USK68334.1 UTP--glucose-1-phosphate uridylyltransferase GalU [Peribacillus asahii]